MLDCVVIGSGLAGISAALTLRANGKSFKMFGAKDLSEKVVRAERIDNYPGLSSISGADFCDALSKQLEDAQIKVEENRATGVFAMKDKVVTSLQSGDIIESKTVILACGVESVKEVDGEAEFLGRGVSYCATCDGFLYKGKTIAVVSTSKRYEHEVEYLADLAKTVYFIPLYKNAVLDRENVVKQVAKIKKIDGKKRVEKMIFQGKDGEKEIAIDGVFFLKDSISPSALVGGIAMQDGHIVVDREMKTNLKGIYAAGDCTGRPYQYAKAVGEGNVAAHAVTKYCAENN